MDGKQQHKWLVNNGFVDQKTVTGNSITWFKEYSLFTLIFYWLNSNKTWDIYIGDKVDEILIAELPEDADFTQLEPLIQAFNIKYK